MIFRKSHSIKICFTVNSWSPSHWSHKGGWGLFSILNECIRRVWHIRRRLIITSSFIFVHPEQYFSAIWVIMACNLLSTSLSHRSSHKDEIKGWIFIKMSVHGSSKFSGCAFDKASFAARSASSFPLISLWLGSQQNIINLELNNISWHVCKTLFTRGFLLSWLSIACNTDILSEDITKLFLVETFTYVKALLIASTSAVKILHPSLSL